ncbi:MAG: hypothetical protein P4L51_17020 [Puia sp.]|nr:hypothetical protein [Puia sp.]
MHKPLFLLSLLLLSLFTVKGQLKPVDFELRPPGRQVSNSLYGKILVLDSRSDTTNLGMTKGDERRIVPKIPLSSQLQTLVDSLKGGTAGNGSLLLQIRGFRFAEEIRGIRERGCCYLRLILYAKTPDGYRKLDLLDTVVEAKFPVASKQLNKAASESITGLIAKNLVVSPGDSTSARPPNHDEKTYSYYQLTRLDSLEKADIKLYNCTEYKEGAYMSYQALKDQTPDYQILKVSYDTGRISTIRVAGKNGKSEKLKNDEIYAIVYQENLYVSTPSGYFQVGKNSDNDFFFIGRYKRPPSAGDRMAAGLMLGLAGSLLSASGYSVPCEMKIDHLTGAFIPTNIITRP